MKKYISTGEIIDKYGVSNVTVAKWMLKTSQDETGLKYDKVGKRIKILNKQENWIILDALGAKASKKRQSIYTSTTKVEDKIYEYFSTDEIIEIARDLEFKSTINTKFTYKGEGALHWSNFYDSAVSTKSYLTPFRTKKVLEQYLPLIFDKLKDYEAVNIVDMGPGNIYPTLDFVKGVKQKLPLLNYVCVDISEGLLEQSISNLVEAVGDISYHSYKRDFQRDRLDQAFTHGYSDEKKVANIILLMGGTPFNTSETVSIFKNISRSMGPHDILICDAAADNDDNNTNFKYLSPESYTTGTWLLKCLGIEVDKCEFGHEFFENPKQKVTFLTLNKDYFIEFKKENFYRKVTLRKKDKLNFITYFVPTIDSTKSMLDEAGFQLLDAITLPNKKHFMIAVQPKMRS